MVGYSRKVVLFAFVLSFYIPDLSLAEQQNSPLQERLQLVMARPDSRQQASYAGQDRALICSYCHGEDGNSVKPDVPNLAGQNPGYLLEQIGRFASGERKDFVMNSLASKFTEQDQINLAIYYSSKKVQPEKYDRNMARQGKGLYLKQCQSCHGTQGRGNTGYARLAGQKQAYIKNTLTRFRANAGAGKVDKKRRSTIMEPIASGLSDRDIQTLAAYLASLR